MTPSPRFVRALELSGLGLALLVIVRYMAPRAGYAWDFETFYYAAAALRQGLDPYRLESLTAVAGKPVPLPFLYPPAALLVFVPFVGFPLASATVAWLALKIALCVALVALWSREFLRGIRLATVLLVGVFGFNAALVMDLRSGNAAILEGLALWIAFACYAREQRWPFAILVSVASALKLLPIAFLALLLIPSRRSGPELRPLLAGLGLFGAIVFLPAAWGASWPAALLAGVPAVRPHGEFNPSALGLLDTLLGGSRGAAPRFPDPAVVLWTAYALTLLIASRGLLRRALKRKDPVEWVVIACLLFALLSPRMMAYSYILIIAPAIMVIYRLFSRARDRAMAMALLVVQGVVRLGLGADFLLSVPGLPLRDSPVIANLPFLTTLGLWVALLKAKDRARDRGIPAYPTVAGAPGPARTPRVRAR